MAWRFLRLPLGQGRRSLAALSASVGLASGGYARHCRCDDEAARSRGSLVSSGFSRARRPSAAVLCEEAPRLRYGTVRLRDGRLLAYHEEGEGVPVFAFHGMCSSRLTWLGAKPLSEVCPGVRLIAIDRPGYGGSSPPPFGYSYSAFVRDVKELADALGLERFCVAGHSSGGPYALAAAAELPGRVTACAAVSSDAPYSHPMVPPQLRAADESNHMTSTTPGGLYGREPSVFAEGMRSRAMAAGNPTKLHAWKSGTDGWVCDFTLERIPWSFTVESIALGPRLTVWVGSEDIPAISVGAPFLQQLVPGAQLRVVEGGDHGFKSKPEHLAEILSSLKAAFDSA
eukprot:TRINITY_DN70679_c0_g1_i1.p1 TRINITY_DN70679_c0_g1~~TRINITY_DN70679_c0_g1_i1.p1  ORF type:complete len:342 (+),score=57.35 TRINITY_DN70679_c0_g1_i1:74-1099(+)